MSPSPCTVISGISTEPSSNEEREDFEVFLEIPLLSPVVGPPVGGSGELGVSARVTGPIMPDPVPFR